MSPGCGSLERTPAKRRHLLTDTIASGRRSTAKISRDLREHMARRRIAKVLGLLSR